MTVELPSEMISGPDLGGGFLFQLTRDRVPAPGFTFHAQEGGSDAGGPPKASPEPLGYRHPSSACLYGGPGCWHRSFALAEAETSRVRLAYNRTRFAMEALIEQVAGTRPVPIEVGLAEFIDRAGRVLESEGLPWFVGGSAGALAQGVALEPRDLDVGTTRAGAERIAELLDEQLIEPLAPEAGPAGGTRWTARAYLGTFRSGVKTEWASVTEPAAASSTPREFEGPGVWERRRRCEWNGRTLWVSPLEFSLVRAAERRSETRVERIARAMRERGEGDGSLLAELLRASSLDAEARERIRRLATVPP
jgi:hypothetical protein